MHKPSAPVGESPASTESPQRRGGLARLRRIVVGFNEGAASRDALAFAKTLCAQTGAELIVASVHPGWSERIGPADYARVVSEDEAQLRREATMALGARPFATHVVAGGSATTGLKEIAASEGADLLVLGSTHRGPVGRVMPGSVGERVLNDSPCAVAIAPLGLAVSEPGLDEIAIAYDGSKEAAVALELAVELADRVGASLVILGAVELDIDVTGMAPETLDEVEVARMQRHLRRARQLVPPSVSVETCLLRGPPNHVIVEAAEGSDLLLLGSRGHYGPARRLFLGSVAARVARTAPCATLITPAP